MGLLDAFRKKKQTPRPKPVRRGPDQHIRNYRMLSRRTMVVRYTFIGERHLRGFDYGFNVKAAVLAGLDAWSRANPGRLAFARAPRRAPLQIEFRRLGGEAGHASKGTFPGGRIRVDLRIHSSFDQVRDTVAHEFGHVVGYGHSSEPSNLMFAPNEGGNPESLRTVRRLRLPHREEPSGHQRVLEGMPAPAQTVSVPDWWRCGTSSYHHS